MIFLTYFFRSSSCYYQTTAVSTLRASGREALLRVRYQTLGGQSVRFRLLDPEGCAAAETEAAGESGTAELHVSSPLLWSPDRPVLYRLEGEVLSGGQAKNRQGS